MPKQVRLKTLDEIAISKIKILRRKLGLEIFDDSLFEVTPRGQLIQEHLRLTEDARGVMMGKNQDYASAQDPFANFRTFGGLGILVRLSDKLARLRQFEERGNGRFTVSDESLRDTILDGINYLILYYAYKQQEPHDNQLDAVRSTPSGTVAQEVPRNGRTRVDG